MKLDFGDVASPAALDEMWSAVEKGRRARVRRRRVLSAVAIVVLSGAGLAAGWLMRPTPPLAPLNVAQTVLAGELAPGEHFFADGSRITLEGTTRVAVTENSGPALSFKLDEGLAHFSVTPKTGRTWRVFAGDTVVEVVGTVFEVETIGSRVRVFVQRGIVKVSGPRVPGSEVLLTAGQQLEVSDPLAVKDTTPASPTPPKPVAVREPSEDAELPVAPQRPDVADPRVLKNSPVKPSVVREAPVRQVTPGEEGEPPSPVVNVAEALRAADLLRANGRDEEAMVSLRLLVEQHPDAPEAALAAFTLARLHQQREEPALARRWYQRALSLGLAEPLRSSAQRALLEVP